MQSRQKVDTEKQPNKQTKTLLIINQMFWQGFSPLGTLSTYSIMSSFLFAGIFGKGVWHQSFQISVTLKCLYYWFCHLNPCQGQTYYPVLFVNIYQKLTLSMLTFVIEIYRFAKILIYWSHKVYYYSLKLRNLSFRWRRKDEGRQKEGTEGMEEGRRK